MKRYSHKVTVAFDVESSRWAVPYRWELIAAMRRRVDELEGLPWREVMAAVDIGETVDLEDGEPPNKKT